MRGETVAANYAATLFELGRRHDALAEFGDGIATVAELVEQEKDFRTFLETPRIDDSSRKDLMRRVFGDRLPGLVLNFLFVVVDRGRQRLLIAISSSYQAMLDEHLGREHVQVTLARPADDAMRAVIAERLTTLLGREAIPHVEVRPEILGGIVVRAGDAIYDGSVRGRLKRLRHRLLGVRLAH